MHLIAINWFAANEQALTLLVMFDTGYLLGDILGVHIVHDGAERRNVISCGVHTSIDAVQQGDVADAVLREVSLHVVAGKDIVTSQTTQVFSNDHVYLSSLYVGDHALEIRTVEICSGPTIVNIGVVDAKTVLLNELIEQRLLVVDALGRALALILL